MNIQWHWVPASLFLAGCQISQMTVADVVRGPDVADAADASTSDQMVVDDIGPGFDAATLDVSCPSGQTLCGGSCVDLSTDPGHCGTCTNDCTALPMVDPAISCVGGSCDLAGGCGPGWAHCSGMQSTGCDTAITTSAHCGSCTTACTGATPICSSTGTAGAQCVSGCATGQSLCGSACVDLSTDAANCGTCSMACAAGQRCTAGHCAYPCPPTFPVSSFNASANPANACNISSILRNDGAEAGLDYLSGSGTIDGQTVTGCVAADFGAIYHMARVIVRANSEPLACAGGGCSTACNTGDAFSLFVGTIRGTYHFVRTTTIQFNPMDYTATVNTDARYVVVCRGGYGAARDDVGVDSVSAACM